MIMEDHLAVLEDGLPTNYQNILHEFDIYSKNGGNSYVHDKIEDYKKWFNTELTLAEKKEWLTTKHKADPDTLATAISEITFDITTNLTYFFKKYDVDSRQIWEEVLNWAWEFQYDWENDPVQEDYLSWIDNFAYFKIRDLENKYEFYKIGN